jgi:hypothetical protein
MAKMKDHCDLFLAALGARLSTLGFPAKIIRKTLFFQQSTEAGYVGIHVNPIYRPNSIDFSLSCAVSVTSVQELLVHTELYSWDRGLTWTCGALLKQMRHIAGLVPAFPSWYDLDGKYHFDKEKVVAHVDKYGSDDGFVVSTDTEEQIALRADVTFGYINEVSWPFLQKYGMTEADMLQLTLQTDELAELCFLDPRKPLTGLILARKLGRRDLFPVLIENANERYDSSARHGNPALREQFKRIGRQLDLL